MQLSEKQFNTKATTDAFDEIYTNYDLSVKETYIADNGFPFDYPTKWLNDPSMNKRIAIRRLDVTPTSHSFTLHITAESAGHNNTDFEKIATIDVTEYDNLIKVLNFMCNVFKFDDNSESAGAGLRYVYDNQTNELSLFFLDFVGNMVNFQIEEPTFYQKAFDNNLEDFMKFLNQGNASDFENTCITMSTTKDFKEVWNRDRLHFHATFSTSKRKFIGKRKDFYQNLTLLYPPPTNESTFYIRFTSNGIKNILIRYCDFDVQLCFIVNYKKSAIL